MKYFKKITLYLLGFMLLFTIISRLLDNYLVPNVTTAMASRRVLENKIILEGTIEKRKQVPIYVEDSQQIIDIVGLGTRVKIGDRLLQLGTSSLTESLNLLSNDVKELETEIREKEIKLEQAKQDYQRLINVGHSAENEEPDTEESEKNNDDSELFTAEQTVNEAQILLNLAYESTNNTLSLKRARINDIQTILNNDGWIFSEQEGVVLNVNKKIGDLTDKEAVIELSDNTSENILKITTDRLLDTINYTSSNVIGINDQSQEVLYEESQLIGSYMNENNERVYHFSLGNKGFKSDSTATISLVNESQEFDYTLPLEAIVEEGQKYYVYSITNKESILKNTNEVKKNEVNIIKIYSDYVALEENNVLTTENIVVTKDKSINPGDNVRIMKGSSDNEEN